MSGGAPTALEGAGPWACIAIAEHAQQRDAEGTGNGVVVRGRRRRGVLLWPPRWSRLLGCDSCMALRGGSSGALHLPEGPPMYMGGEKVSAAGALGHAGNRIGIALACR